MHIRAVDLAKCPTRSHSRGSCARSTTQVAHHTPRPQLHEYLLSWGPFDRLTFKTILFVEDLAYHLILLPCFYPVENLLSPVKGFQSLDMGSYGPSVVLRKGSNIGHSWKKTQMLQARVCFFIFAAQHCKNGYPLNLHSF